MKTSLFLLLCVFIFNAQFQKATAQDEGSSNKQLTFFQDKTYVGLASEDNKEIIYTQCDEPISTFYFDESNGAPMFVLGGLYDIMMYELVSIKKENNVYMMIYVDNTGDEQMAQLELFSDEGKVYLMFRNMRMGFVLREKMADFRIVNDCDQLPLAKPKNGGQ